VWTDDEGSYPKIWKTRSNGKTARVTWRFKFWNPSISTERLKIQTLNLVCGLKTWRPIQKLQNYVNWEQDLGHVTYILNFVTPSISKERLKMQTSNLVCRLTTRGTIQKFAKLGQMGKRPGSPELLLNFGPLYIYGTAEDTNFKFGV